jgi:hypothetical protein
MKAWAHFDGVEKLVAVQLAMVFFLNWLAKNPDPTIYGPSYLNLIPKQSILLVELLQLALLVVLFKKAVVLGGATLGMIEKLSAICAALLIFFAPFAFLYDATPINFAVGIRNYFGFIPLLVAGYYISTEGKAARPLLKFILACGLMQLPITAIQFAYALQSSSWLRTQGTVYDVVAGSMGGLAGNLLSIVLASIMAVAYAVLDELNARKWILAGLVCALTIPMVLSEAKGGVLFLAIIGLYFVVTHRSDLKAKLMLFGVFGAALVGFVVLYVSLLGLERQIWDLGYFVEYELSKGSSVEKRLSRIDVVGYSLEEVADEGISIMGGLGLGNATNNSFGGRNGKYFSFYTDIHTWNRLILEGGLAGIGIFLAGGIFLWRRGSFLQRQSPDVFVRGFARGYLCLLLIGLFSGFYTDFFTRVQYSYPFALVTGFLLAESHRIRAVPRSEVTHGVAA